MVDEGGKVLAFFVSIPPFDKKFGCITKPPTPSLDDVPRFVVFYVFPKGRVQKELFLWAEFSTRGEELLSRKMINFGTSGRRCSRSVLGGRLAMTLVDRYFHHYFPFFPFFFSVATFSHRRSARIKKLI